MYDIAIMVTILLDHAKLVLQIYYEFMSTTCTNTIIIFVIILMFYIVLCDILPK